MSLCVKIRLRRRRVFDEFFEGWVFSLVSVVCLRELLARESREAKFFSERRFREKFQLDE